MASASTGLTNEAHVPLLGAGTQLDAEDQYRQHTPSHCFETFPILTPERRVLDSIGEAFHPWRAQVQRDRGLGLTKLWNLLVDPANEDADIVRLRALKADMDRAELDAYGWPEVDPGDSREIVRQLRRLNAERAQGG